MRKFIEGRRKTSVFLIILFGIIPYNHVNAAIWYVYPESYTGGNNSGTSPENAFQGFVSINGVIVSRFNIHLILLLTWRIVYLTL